MASAVEVSNAQGKALCDEDQVWKGFKRRPVFVYESEKTYSYILKGSSVKSVLSEHGHNFIYSSLRIEEINSYQSLLPWIICSSKTALLSPLWRWFLSPSPADLGREGGVDKV